MEIPRQQYVDIHRLMPIICVDCVVLVDNKILMVKRKYDPMKNAWWFPGGRLYRGEKLRCAVGRIVKKETNIDLRGTPVLLGHGETEFVEDPFGHNQGTHTVNFVYASTISELSLMGVALDDHHITYSTFDFEEVYSGNMHPYIKRFVALAEGALKR